VIRWKGLLGPFSRFGPFCFGFSTASVPATPHARGATRIASSPPSSPDRSSPLLLEKRRAIAGGRNDIEIVDYPGLLLANALIDTDELGTLRLVEGWLGPSRTGWRPGPVLPMPEPGTPRLIAPGGVCWPCVWCSSSSTSCPPSNSSSRSYQASEAKSELAALRAGIAGIAAWLRHGRREACRR
jgi:hypothetical protein